MKGFVDDLLALARGAVVNYYDHHIGDYDSATAHLSWFEDAAYRRLICLYYRTERPIPLDLKAACRLVRAQDKDQRAAVETVLQEFFEPREDGWHQQRCDDEIAEYNSTAPEREARKTNEALRMTRHREERAALFVRLNAAGQHASWNASIAQLREMVRRLDEGVDDRPETATLLESGKPATAPATQSSPKPATPVTAPATRPATAPATPATATQYPLTNTHSPVPIGLNTNTASTDVLAPAFPDEKQPEPELPGLPKAQIPDCPHLKVLELWAEVLPALPQHNPEMWKGARADHLRARWRETSILKKWPDQDAGIAYFRKLFRYVGTSPFLTGQARSTDPSKRPFTIELEWLVNPSNWAKVHEGKYHSEA